MTISANYLTLQQQIADELGDRQDLLSPLSDSSLTNSPIVNAIQSAIAKWEREPFYFNELLLETPLTAPSGGYPFQTVAGQEYYGASSYANIPTLAVIKKLWVLVSGQRYTLEARTAQYLEDISVNQSSLSQPVDYSYQALQLRFYPIPDNSYPVGIYGTQRLTPLVNGTDANAWTQDAYDLIRSEAKSILAREVLYDETVYAAMQRAIYGDPTVRGDRGYLYALKAENSRRGGQGRMRPTYF